MKKKMMIALSYVLILALGIVGTIAYLTNEDEVVNTFELDDDVEITLDEAPVAKNGDIYEADDEAARVKANTYENVYPGAVMPKDPIVHLSNDASTADAYVKATVTIPNAKAWLGITEADLIELTGDTIGANWRFMKGENVGEDVVYTLIYTERMVPGSDTTAVFEKIVFPAEYDTAEITQYFGADLKFNVNVKAYSIQAAGFTSAIQAFGVKEGTMDIWDGGVNEDLDTTAATIEVASAEDLAAVAAAVNNSGDLSGKTIKLTKDIDLAGMEWTPIGQTGGYYAKNYFKGTFDGQGHTIYNMTINNTNDGASYAAGFFGFLDCGQTGAIKNLNFDNATVKGHHWTGVVAGYTSGTIENCKVTNSTVVCTHVSDSACGDKAGGITGYINGTQGAVVNCTVADSSVSAGRDGGAVVGAAYGTQVTGCSFENVTVTASAGCTDEDAGKNINVAVVGRVL